MGKMTINIGNGLKKRISDDAGVLADNFTEYLNFPADYRIDETFTIEGGSANEMATNSPGIFEIKPPSNEVYVLWRMNLYIQAAKFSPATGYGGLGNPLVNGILVQVQRDGSLFHDYTAIPIKKSFHWGLLAGVDVDVTDAGGDDPMLIRWTFVKGGAKCVLWGNKNDRLIINCQDDLDAASWAIVSQIAIVQGLKFDIISED